MLVSAVVLAFVGAAGVRAGECDRFAVQVATDPAPYQYPRGLEKAYQLLGNVPSDADTILIGDSLVANWPADMARRQFQSEHVWNFAVGGSVTQNTLWQLQRLEHSQQNPGRLMVLIGTNNLTREDMPACAVAAGIKQVVTAAHAKWPRARIDVMGIPPRGVDFHFRDAARLAVNADIKAWTKGVPDLHYFEVDASEISCGQYDRLVQVAAANEHTVPACANYADDFGHFKRAGYEVIFSAMTKGDR